MKTMYRWIPALGWMGVIYYLSSQTGDDLQGMFPFLDSLNFGHVIAYFVLSFLFYWAMLPVKQRVKFDIRWIAIILSFFYGLTDEWHQAFVPGRMPDYRDIVNDILGATLSMAMVTLYLRKRKK